MAEIPGFIYFNGKYYDKRNSPTEFWNQISKSRNQKHRELALNNFNLKNRNKKKYHLCSLIYGRQSDLQKNQLIQNVISSSLIRKLRFSNNLTKKTLNYNWMCQTYKSDPLDLTTNSILGGSLHSTYWEISMEKRASKNFNKFKAIWHKDETESRTNMNLVGYYLRTHLFHQQQDVAIHSNDFLKYQIVIFNRNNTQMTPIVNCIKIEGSRSKSRFEDYYEKMDFYEAYIAVHLQVIRSHYYATTQGRSADAMLLNRLSTHDVQYNLSKQNPTPVQSISGFHNGLIFVINHDHLNSTNEAGITRFKCGNRTIDYVRWHPTNSYQFVVSGADSFLKLFDTRMLDFRNRSSHSLQISPVINFSEHYNSSGMYNFMIDPISNVLVSPGSDGLVRFWNSLNGSIVNLIKPEYVDENDIVSGSALYSSNFNFDSHNRGELLYHDEK
ncbi:hypothetical protein BLOT_004785 [Blomia tropicalis]|nr:hypothetical protein BLOT_004785 [Blomia tropicalis]